MFVCFFLQNVRPYFLKVKFISFKHESCSQTLIIIFKGKITRIFIIYLFYEKNNPVLSYMDVSEPKWVNSILNIIGANSLRLGDLHNKMRYVCNTSFVPKTTSYFSNILRCHNLLFVHFDTSVYLLTEGHDSTSKLHAVYVPVHD